MGGARISILLLVAGTLGVGCAPSDAPSRAALEGAPRLVSIEHLRSAPLGGDGPSVERLAWRMVDGEERPIAHEAIAHVDGWRGGGALVDPAGGLFALDPERSPRRIDEGATGSLAVSPSGRRLAYVVERGFLGALRISEGGPPDEALGGMAGIGRLHFLDEATLLFIGGPPGSVAGLYSFDLEAGELRCHTHCELRTGEPWGERFTPPPTDLAEVVVEGSHLAWTDARGARRTSPLREGR